MQLEEILSDLENHTGSFPHLALERAIAEREAITPILLTTLERLSNNLKELLEKEEYILHIYALYLLAQFREPLAYPVIVKFFSSPGDDALDVAGDVVTEDLGRIFASVSGGNIEPIKQIIENEEINEYIRGAALDSLLVLVAQEVISREQVIQYHANLFSSLDKDKSDYMWTSLVLNSAELGATELKEQIDRVFEEDLVEEFFVSREDVNDDLQVGIEAALNRLRENSHYSFVEDVISEMEDWACFQPKKIPQMNNRSIPSEGFDFSTPKKSKDQTKKKKKMQEQSRRKNRSKKK